MNHKIKAPPSFWLDDEYLSTSDIGKTVFEDILRSKTTLSQDDINIVMSAYITAKYAHAYKIEVKRRTGERYFEHPKAVALIDIIEFNQNDPEVIMAELLHDLIEDTYYTEAQLYYLFGEKVANIVKLVSSPRKLGSAAEVEKKLEVHFKVIEMNKQACFVKVCDRIHNLRTLPTFNKKDKDYKEKKGKLEAKIIETEKLILPIARKLKSYNPKYLDVLISDINNIKLNFK